MEALNQLLEQVSVVGIQLAAGPSAAAKALLAPFLTEDLRNQLLAARAAVEVVTPLCSRYTAVFNDDERNGAVTLTTACALLSLAIAHRPSPL